MATPLRRYLYSGREYQYRLQLRLVSTLLDSRMRIGRLRGKKSGAAGTTRCCRLPASYWSRKERLERVWAVAAWQERTHNAALAAWRYFLPSLSSRDDTGTLQEARSPGGRWTEFAHVFFDLHSSRCHRCHPDCRAIMDASAAGLPCSAYHAPRLLIRCDG